MGAILKMAPEPFNHLRLSVQFLGLNPMKMTEENVDR
jgi:hypothetical protein